MFYVFVKGLEKCIKMIFIPRDIYGFFNKNNNG